MLLQEFVIGPYSQIDLENYAEVLLWGAGQSRGRELATGDVVIIRYDHQAIALVESLYSLCMDRHLRPVPLAKPTPLMEVERYLNSSFAQLTFQPAGRHELFASAAACINLMAPEDLVHLQSIDPHIVAEARRAEEPLLQMLERRRRSGALGWTMGLYPTHALAEASGLSFEDYAAKLHRGCWLNMPNPLREWKRIQRELHELCAWLDGMGIQSFHVEGEHLDLHVPLGNHRRFRALNGSNIPGSEIYVAPDYRDIRGIFYANQPNLRMGHLVHNVTLEFHGGVVTSANADRGLAFLQRQLYADAGARMVGEFSLTDKRHSRIDCFMAHVLFDENVGGEYGNCHIALGASLTECFSGPPEALTPELEETLGFNVSGIHWDMVNTEPKRVTASLGGGQPRLIYENGQFVF